MTNSHRMKTKLEEIVADKCRDMGLSRAALDGLIGVLGKGIGEESGEEEVQRTAAEITEVEKTMQGEASRWSGKVGQGRVRRKCRRPPPEDAVARAVADAMGQLREELDGLRAGATAL